MALIVNIKEGRPGSEWMRRVWQFEIGGYDLWRAEDEAIQVILFHFDLLLHLGVEGSGSLEKRRVNAYRVVAHNKYNTCTRPTIQNSNYNLAQNDSASPEQSVRTCFQQKTPTNTNKCHHRIFCCRQTLINIQSSMMNTHEKASNQSEKIAKQSYALLQRLKSKKEKVATVPNQENYIEDLYLKIFNKCSPHFDKMETSNQILSEFKSQIKSINEIRQENQQNIRLNSQLKNQLAKVNESKDETPKVKTLNIQLNKLEQLRQDNAMMIKSLKKQNQSMSQELQQLHQQLQKANELNAELEEFVEKFTRELQKNSHKENHQQNQNQIAQLRIKLEKVSQELLQGEDIFKTLNDQNTNLRSTLDQRNEIILSYQKQLNQKQQLFSKIITQLQQHKSASQSEFNEKLSKYASELTALQSHNTSILQQNSYLKTEINSLQSSCKVLKQQAHNLTLINKKLSLEIQNLKETILQKQQDSNRYEQQTIKFIQSLKTNAQDIERLQSILDNTNQTNLKLIQENQQLQQMQIDLKNKLASTQQQLKEKIEELKERLKFFKENNQNLNNQKVDFINNIELLAQQIQKLTQQISRKEQQIQYILKEKQSEINAAISDKQKQFKALWKEKQSQFDVKLEQTVKYYQNLLSEKEKQCNKIKNWQMQNELQQRIRQEQHSRCIESLRIEANEQKIALELAHQQCQQLESKVREQYQRIEKLENQKQDLKQQLSKILQQQNQSTINLKESIEQSNQRLLLNKEERDHLSQEKIILKQENQKMQEENNKLRSEVNQRKLKVHKHEEKICELNQIINSYQNAKKNSEFIQSNKEQNQNPSPQEEDKLESKCNKHIETINQLSGELTEAYKMIQELQHTITELKLKSEGKLDRVYKSSVEKKERGKSMKKIANIFGF